MSLFLLSLALLAAPTALVAGAETPGVWNVQRLKQNCGKGGCNLEFYINGELKITSDPYSAPGTRDFDARCTGLAFGGDWTPCQSLIPYTPADRGGRAKMGDVNKTSGSVEVWYAWVNWEGQRQVKETGRMVVEAPRLWDVAKCRQMAIVSREYV
ncbi:hypothetical protein CCM_05741 [Cordyceps militaris CM01]|uniref:Uncharacterized protein n=1 Tax=Cordyceps militaris (strain CM01) TaxID=983644 RepID=G3JH27_CORMM|nr:uncharacterized protein CCM_05741 [Cordyceps militaris CM01]EGX91583.1 hypothetical protein CCM_05741 [Cordyceps militaris CM01]